jgi:hypothetical protein
MSDLLSGQLGYVFLVAVLDGALLSWVALVWYRRSVRRLMAKGTGASTSVPPVAVPAATAGAAARGGDALSLRLLEPAKVTAPSRPDIENRPTLRSVAAAYVAGAALHSAVVTWLLLRPEASTLPLVAWFISWWVNAWAVVPTLILLLVLDRVRSLRLIAWYVGAGLAAQVIVTLAIQTQRGSFNSAPLTNAYWMMASLIWTASVPLALLLVVAWRRIRAVMPLALAATLLFGFGSIAAHEALLGAINVESVGPRLLALAGGSWGLRYGVFFAVSLPVGWVAWRLLRMLAAAYERKRFSDVQLVADCWWVVVTAEQIAVGLSQTYGAAGIAGGLSAFLVYRLAVAFVLRRAPRISEQLPNGLLLLRVFGHQPRTERLFDRVAQRWRFHGPVQLIAGADLAERTADPGDVLAFIGGELAGKYVADPADVRRRLERLDLARDPDGRFRVNEVYCHDHTWRPALQALLDASTVVLMDLRTFSESNAGCVFELRQLVRRVPTDRIVLVFDETTDLRLLESVLDDGWASAREEGLARGPNEITLVRVGREASWELDLLVQRLLAQGEPRDRVAAAKLV